MVRQIIGDNIQRNRYTWGFGQKVHWECRGVVWSPFSGAPPPPIIRAQILGTQKGCGGVLGGLGMVSKQIPLKIQCALIMLRCIVAPPQKSEKRFH